MVCVPLSNVRTVEWHVHTCKQTAASLEHHVELRLVALGIEALVGDGLLQIAPVCTNSASPVKIELKLNCFLHDPIHSD